MKKKGAIIGKRSLGEKISQSIEKEVFFTELKLYDWVFIAKPNDLHYGHMKNFSWDNSVVELETVLGIKKQ